MLSLDVFQNLIGNNAFYLCFTFFVTELNVQSHEFSTFPSSSLSSSHHQVEICYCYRYPPKLDCCVMIDLIYDLLFFRTHMLDEETEEDFVSDILQEVVTSALDQIYFKIIEKRLIPYTVKAAKDLLLEVIEVWSLMRPHFK